MADKQSTKPPSGTRDFLPDDVRRREHVINVVRGVYERYGFEPLETPAFENIDTLLGKYGEEGNKLIFKILKRGEHEGTGEADLALRYDLTVPLARVVAQYQNELPKFFKRYQIQPVWRADRPARGRFREFYQCDIDAIGSKSPVVEAEVLSAVSEVLVTLGFADFTIRLNHRALLSALLEVSGLPPEKHSKALVSLDKLDKAGQEVVIAEMVGIGIGSSKARDLLATFMGVTTRTNEEVLTSLRVGSIGLHTGGIAALDALSTILSLSEGTAAAGKIRFDPSLARGLSYYTGAIMEIAVPDMAGSLGGGGRYDNLIGMFLGRDVAACGFSLGLERIIVVMTERDMFPATVASGVVDVFVAWRHDDLRGDVLRIAATLRARGLRVEVYPQADKLLKQFEYAEKRKARRIAVVGEREVAAGKVTLRDPATRQERLASMDDIVAELRGPNLGVPPTDDDEG